MFDTTFDASTLHDMQGTPDLRGIALQRVGIKDIAVPMRVQTQAGGYQTVHAACELTVGLPSEFRGTHMSRFVEILSEWQKRNLSGGCVEDLVREVQTRLAAPTAAAAIRFKYFVDKPAPASGLSAVTDLDCSFEGEVGLDGVYRFTLGVAVPMTTLCPCSKAISKYGAHNQRSLVGAKVRWVVGRPSLLASAGEPGPHSRSGCVWIEDLARGLEECGSCPIYPLLKREDEKVVTERAYENPKFVEDVLRDAILYLRALPGIDWFSLECTNYESIHNHNAFAAHEEWVGAE